MPDGFDQSAVPDGEPETPPTSVETAGDAVLVVSACPDRPEEEERIDWSRLGDATRELLREHTYATSTRRSYESAWRRFVGWCKERGIQIAPPSPYVVADYLAHLGSLQPTSVARIETAAAAIACAMVLAGHRYDRRHEVVVKTITALRHKIGVAPQHQKTPLVAELVERVCEPLGESLIDVRDRAILVVGFLMGSRGSNLAALNVADFAFVAQGLDITLRRSKTDQEGKGRLLSIPLQSDADLCASRVARRWLDAAGIQEGAVFRAVDRWGHVGDKLTRQEVSRIVKRRCEAVGLNPDAFGSHSLRSGFSTSARENGATMDRIRDQTGHESVDGLMRYIRHADRYRNNAASGLLGRK
jgi:integrase